MASPIKMDNGCLWGLSGQIINGILPHTEASAAALLSQLLCAYGNIVGRSPYFRTEADLQRTNIFVLNVGLSSKGRKGTSWGYIERLFSSIDPEWIKNNVKSGLSSGEGLLWPLRDPASEVPESPFEERPSDKRLLCIEPEFSSLLKVMGREGNTLSAIVRNAWDGKTLSTLTKKDPIVVSDPHVSIIGHITKTELLKQLSDNDISNGFGNRFLYFFVERSKILPEGGLIDPYDFELMVRELKASIEFGRMCNEIKRNAQARELWASVYPKLSEGEMGLVGALNSRAEAQVVRLSLLQALMNRKIEIDEDCLRSALEIQKYSAKTLRTIFGYQTGISMADKIYDAIRASNNGLSRTDINNLFNRNSTSLSVGSALKLLEEQGLIWAKSIQTNGRSEQRWVSLEGNEINELNEISPLNNDKAGLNSFNS